MENPKDNILIKNIKISIILFTSKFLAYKVESAVLSPLPVGLDCLNLDNNPLFLGTGDLISED